MPHRLSGRGAAIALDGRDVLYARLPSPLGPMLALGRAGALVGVFFADEKRRPRIQRTWRAAQHAPVFRALQRQLAQYFAGRRCAFALPVRPAGTAFQSRVWAALAAIPYGQVQSYAAIARGIGAGSPRAVGAAVGRNPLGIVIPCHRAVGTTGALTGYGGGLARKRALLELEGARPESRAAEPGRARRRARPAPGRRAASRSGPGRRRIRRAGGASRRRQGEPARASE